MNREQLSKDPTKTGDCLIPVRISIDKVESLSHFGVVRDWIIKLKNGEQIEISADVIKKIVKHEREENHAKEHNQGYLDGFNKGYLDGKNKATKEERT